MENNKSTSIKEEISKLADEIINSVEITFKSIVQNLKQKGYEPRTLKDFANMYIEPADELLINELKNTKLEYIGGDFKLFRQSDILAIAE